MKILLITAFFMVSLSAYCQEIILKVKNLKSSKGILVVDVYTSKDDFLKKSALNKKLQISGNSATTTIEELQAGVYAIGVFHDENESGELDTNFMGIPKEPIGTSNNPKARFGPPKWDDAKFELSGGEKKVLEIDMQ